MSEKEYTSKDKETQVQTPSNSELKSTDNSDNSELQSTDNSDNSEPTEEDREVQASVKRLIDGMEKEDTKDTKTGHLVKLKRVIRVIGNVLKVSIVIVLALVLIGLTGMYIKVKPILDKAKATSYSRMLEVNDGTFINKYNTQVYDKDKSLIGEVNISNFEYVKASDISPYIKTGYIAVEDRNYLTHKGIDYKGLARATISLIKHKGRVTQGGSTVTQQVLKNNVLTDLKGWERKVVEYYLAPTLEKEYSKDLIMEFYCNTNYYQNGLYGIGAASRYYFGKSASELTLGEASGLCGLSNNPAKFNPVKHPDAYKQRRSKVLQDMLICGYITEAEYQEAIDEDVILVLEDKPRTKESYQVSYALHCTTLSEMEKQGFQFKYTFENAGEYTEYQNEYKSVYQDISTNIRNGGYKIYTTLDSGIQKALQTEIDNSLKTNQEKQADGRYSLQASATVVDNKTGYVLALVGGRGTDDEFNRAYQGYRQPGSCAKPLVVYGVAMDTGEYYPSKLIKDEKNSKAPANWDNIYRGKVSIRESLERSINTSAYYLMQELTPKRALNYLSKMKFTGLSDVDNYNNSLALGGFTYGTTTVEMAKAYSTIANNGIYLDRNCIIGYTYQENGEEKQTTPSEQDEQVYTPDTSYMLIDILKGVITKGTGTIYQTDNIASGKTGTTNSNKDIWFCSMTEDYTISIWLGYDTPKPIADGTKYTSQIYKGLLGSLKLSNKDFTRPSTIVDKAIDNKGEIVKKGISNEKHKTELFSTVALQQAEEKAIAKEQDKIKVEQIKQQQEQDLIINQLRKELTDIDLSNISNIEQYRLVMNQIDVIKSKLKLIKSDLIKGELEESINSLTGALSTSSIGIEYETEQKLAKQEQQAIKQALKQEQAQAEQDLKDTRITLAYKALNELSLNKYTEDAQSYIAKASTQINECTKYTEYKVLKQQYDLILEEIALNKQQQTTSLDEPITSYEIDNTFSNEQQTDKVTDIPVISE